MGVIAMGGLKRRFPGIPEHHIRGILDALPATYRVANGVRVLPESELAQFIGEAVRRGLLRVAEPEPAIA
jgi:hypothetical protein